MKLIVFKGDPSQAGPTILDSYSSPGTIKVDLDNEGGLKILERKGASESIGILCKKKNDKDIKRTKFSCRRSDRYCKKVSANGSFMFFVPLRFLIS
jgi:hypothetical protein